MCGRASDAVYRLTLDSMEDYSRFNPDSESEPATELTTLFPDSLPSDFHGEETRFVLSRSSPDICIEATPVTNIQDVAFQWYTPTTAQCPFREMNERIVLHRSGIYQGSFVTENHPVIAVPTVPRIELPETGVSHGKNTLHASPTPVYIQTLPEQLGFSPLYSPSSPREPERTLESPSQTYSPSPGQECYTLWNSIPAEAIVVTGSNKYVPQRLYKPYTETDKERYLEQVSLSAPIIFVTKEPFEWGIPLEDVRNGNMQRLVDKDVPVLEDCGPSISIRINWPGYPSFKHQISSRNWRKVKGPTTKKKLAENLTKTTGRFIKKMSNKPLEAGTEANWKVGPEHIKVEDLILVSLHHVSKGSWQPQFRLRYDVA